MAQNVTYERALSYIKNKDKYVQTFVDTALDKLQAMFVYDGLPETVPASELERMLMIHGNVFWTEVDGELYALDGNAGGEPDAYNRPTEYIVANAALKLSRSYKIDEDGVVMSNDYRELGMLPILYKYAALMCDTDISLNTVAILSRITTFISAGDDKTKASAEIFMNKILNGDLSIIAENTLFGEEMGIRTHTANVANSTILMNLVETLQYYKASFLNEIGLNANYNMKREYLNENETSLNIDTLLPLMDNMLSCRREALEKVNAMFGTNISVDFGSVWKATHEQAERVILESLTNYEEVKREQATLADPDGPSGPDGTDPDGAPTPDAPDDEALQEKPGEIPEAAAESESDESDADAESKEPDDEDTRTAHEVSAEDGTEASSEDSEKESESDTETDADADSEVNDEDAERDTESADTETEKRTEDEAEPEAERDKEGVDELDADEAADDEDEDRKRDKK